MRWNRSNSMRIKRISERDHAPGTEKDLSLRPDVVLLATIVN